MTIDVRSLNIPNAMLSSPQVICSGQPDMAGLANAKAVGVRFVINLRPDNEDSSFNTEAAVKSLGMTYMPLPISGASDFTREKVEAFDALIYKTGAEVVLIHCASGNRVGALMALRARWISGLSPDDAMAVGTGAGLTKLASVVQGML